MMIAGEEIPNHYGAFLIERMTRMKIENLDEELSKVVVRDYDYEKAIKDLADHVKNEIFEAVEMKSHIDQVRNDLLHILEFEPLNAPKRIQVANALHKTLLKRREIADRIEYLDAIKPALGHVKPHLNGVIKGIETTLDTYEKSRGKNYHLRKLVITDLKASSIKLPNETTNSQLKKFYGRYRGKHHVDNPETLKEVVSK